MRFCLACRHFSGGGPLCTHCGRSFGGRLCKGRTRHLNPHDAVFCNHCGTPDLVDGATSIPFGWVSRILVFAALFYAGQWLLLAYTRAPSLSFQGLTGYKDARVWIIEKFANVLIILFVFHFLSSFVPGEAGKQFRAAMSSIVLHAIKLFFKVGEEVLHLLGHMLLHAMGIETKAKKKKKH